MQLGAEGLDAGFEGGGFLVGDHARIDSDFDIFGSALWSSGWVSRFDRDGGIRRLDDEMEDWNSGEKK